MLWFVQGWVADLGGGVTLRPPQAGVTPADTGGLWRVRGMGVAPPCTADIPDRGRG